MDKKKYLLIVLFILLIQAAKAQISPLQAADSTSNELYNRADWKQLIAFGNTTLKSGVDFPGLRLRIAYAYLDNGNYKSALVQYDQVLNKDPYNETARYYAYLCNKYLNNDLTASYNVGFLRNKNGLSPFGLINAGAETSAKFNNDENRDNGSYDRFFLSNRLTWRWQLEQSFAYYDQTVFKLSSTIFDNKFRHSADIQKEYFAKLSYAVNGHISILGSYHYLNTEFKRTKYDSNLGLMGITYNNKYADLQADANFGRLDNKPLEQYNAKLTFYPLGNLNLYTISRASDQHLNATNHFIFNQALGFKLIKNTWLELAVTMGDQDDYLDDDGLYVYNAIDNTTFKYGETIFYQLGLHAQLQLNYLYERKDDTYQSLIYNQHDITLGILWKF